MMRDESVVLVNQEKETKNNFNFLAAAALIVLHGLASQHGGAALAGVALHSRGGVLGLKQKTNKN
jgi:hypothetical protein